MAVNVIFVCWCFKRVLDFFADVHLSLVDRISAGFHREMWAPLPGSDALGLEQVWS